MQTDQPAEQQIARLTLLAEARYLPAALAVVREAAVAVGLAAADVTGLDRAVDQVASNVIEVSVVRPLSTSLRPAPCPAVCWPVMKHSRPATV